MTRTMFYVFFLSLAVLGGCSKDTAAPGTIPDTGETIGDIGLDQSGDASVFVPQTVRFQFSTDFAPAVRSRITAHLIAVDADASELGADDPIPSNATVFSFGATSGSAFVFTDQQTAGDEGFRLKTRPNGDGFVVASLGDDIRGDLFGAYRLLEHVGFAFYHPLAPTRPSQFTIEDLDLTTAPRWAFRGLQIHTMHPLELTDLLQGWGPDGPTDSKGWSDLLPEWDAYLEWSLANGQNRVHWVLLEARAWETFSTSAERLDRLTQLVDRAHELETIVGVDVPIVLQQQHAFRLVKTRGTLQQEVAEMQTRVDFLMNAGFDYLATESGTTEFTSPEDVRMVEWMDALADHMDTAHNAPVFIKVHTSAHQTVDNFVDPDTGEPLNFNFLPHYADPRMGVMPHTVQHYSLDDPAPTYGNEDFGYIREFLQEEVGRRPVVWHPETAYWVSFDVDVPLFLPIYADRRIYDLRLLARDEDAGRMGRGEHVGKSMDGQVTFSSGWEWGYWFQEVMTARASWDPRLDIADDDEARFEMFLEFARPFGDAQLGLAAVLQDFVFAQQSLLIEGDYGFGPPDDIVMRNGQAYLQGTETWDDIAELASEWLGMEGSVTQPSRLGMVEMRFGTTPDSFYPTFVQPLLARMSERFTDLHLRLESLRPDIPPHMLTLFDDLVDAAHMTALRARQVHGLYDYVDAEERLQDAGIAAQRLQDARDALDEASVIAQRREASYRVPADRIAGWRSNPTAYGFTYLWTVRSMLFWWRDEAKAVLSPRSPCYLNYINPVSIGFGEGDWSVASDIAADVFAQVAGLGSLAECLGAPTEPTLPPSGLR